MAAYTVDDLKGIKRKIICNKPQKEAFVRAGVLEKLLRVLREQGDDHVLVSTAVQALGSMCSIDEGVCALEKCNGVAVLLNVLEGGSHSSPARQVVWALKLVAKRNGKGVGDQLAENAAAFSSLLDHLYDEAPSVVLNTLNVLGQCVPESKKFALLVEKSYGQAAFMTLLRSSNKEIVLQSVQVYHSILSCTKATVVRIKDPALLVKLLRSKMRQPADEELQLAAAKCIVMISLVDSCAESFTTYQVDVLATLIDLISLLDKNHPDAIEPMHMLTLGYGKFASTVIELDVVPKLIRYVEKGGGEIGVETLNFLRDLSANSESARRQCIDSGILPIVCGMLNSSNLSLQLAACQCLHKLSRSIRALKMHVSTTSVVLDVLMEVAQKDISSDLSLHIISILANFCSEPNSLREALLQKGVLELFSEVFKTSGLPARLKCTALLGVSALAYVSTREIKIKISSLITLADVKELLQLDGHPDNEILENTLILIRNMSHNFGPASSPLRDHWDLEFILKKCLEIARARMSDPSIVVQCLYIAVNAASGRKQEKDAVIESRWHEEIPHLLRSQCDEIREATMWLLQNLIAAPHFLPILNDLHVDMVLESMDSHPNMYIRDRANIVLEEMKKAGGDFRFREPSAAGNQGDPVGAGGRARTRSERAASRMEDALW
jgi:hypothetical protein